MPPLRLLIADDHDIVRKGLCTLLSGQPGWTIAAEASNGREALKMAMECEPDVAVLDIAMPSLNGLETARQMNKTVPSTKVVLLTMHAVDTFIAEALNAGVRGFVLKSDAVKDLVAAVDALGRNQTFFTSEVAQAMIDGHLKPRGTTVSDAATEQRCRLTGRQREVVQLLAEGNSSKQIATVLDLSIKTVETHRADIMNRVNCHGVAELVRYAIRNGIVEP